MIIIETQAVGPFFKNGFVVACEKTREAVVIDPGDEVPGLLAFAEAKALTVRHILLTHAHVDHVTGVGVAKRTIQTYLPSTRAPRPRGQTWAAFLRNHAPDIWACDFLPVTDLLFRPLFAFVIIELASRRVVHVGVTRSPTRLTLKGVLRQPSGPRSKARVRPSSS